MGYTLLGIATFRAKALPRWCGLLLVAQCPLLFFLMASYGSGGVVLGAVWLALGYALLAERDEAKTPRVARAAQQQCLVHLIYIHSHLPRVWCEYSVKAR